MHIDQEFSELIGSIYEGAVEADPWTGFLALLRERLSSNVTTLVLRPPGEGQQGVMFNVGGNTSEISAYNAVNYAFDPFVDLPEGEVMVLNEYIDAAVLQSSDFFRIVMEPSGLNDFLGADLCLADNIRVRIRVARYKGAPAFTDSDKALLSILLPHIRRAVKLHFQIHSIASERTLYAGAIEQLSVGSILLDEMDRVLSCNGLAEKLLSDCDGLSVKDDELLFASEENQREWQASLESLKAKRGSGEPMVAEAMTVARPSGLAS